MMYHMVSYGVRKTPHTHTHTHGTSGCNFVDNPGMKTTNSPEQEENIQVESSSFSGPVIALFVLGSVAGNVFFAKRYGKILERLFVNNAAKKEAEKALSSETLRKNTKLATEISRKNFALARAKLTEAREQRDKDFDKLKENIDAAKTKREGKA
mmetsp:Transcript_28625/g.35940  ORF Transcript_28625/g.35940 Transcript_28625/m.35940 type:complete len:154 (-) Transcript_28625:75-536(-)